MAVKNIEMNYRNESGYDVLYPESILENIVDWQDNIYSKSEVDSQIRILEGLSYKVEAGEYMGTMSGTTDMSSTITTSLPQIDYCFVFRLGVGWINKSNDRLYYYAGCTDKIHAATGWTLQISGSNFMVSNALDSNVYLNLLGTDYLYICFCK